MQKHLEEESQPKRPSASPDDGNENENLQAVSALASPPPPCSIPVDSDTTCMSSGDGGTTCAAAASETKKGADSDTSTTCTDGTAVEEFPNTAVPGAHHEGGSNSSTRFIIGNPMENHNSNPSVLVTANLVPTTDLPVAQQVAQPQQQQQQQQETRQHFSRQVLLCLVGVLLVIASVAVTLVAVSLATKNDSPQNNALVERSNQEREDIVATISKALDIRLSTSRSTSWSRAMQWILHIDPLQLSPHAPNLVQRFWLAYLYYSTTEGQLWSSCNPVNAATSATDNLCYYRHITGDGLFAKVRGIAAYTHWRTMDHELLASRWLSELHECQWAGLFCNDNQTVETLQLDFMNLTGTVPDGLHVLSDLQAISMTYNNLWGTLPDDLASLKNLTFLDFQHNDFSGTVPYSWWSSKDMKENIRTINLSFNPLSAWSLPNEIGKMSKLKHLQLDDSGMTGSIPEELYQLTQLEFFDAETNQITGTLATEIGLLSNLLFLAVSNMDLTGTLPSEVAHMTNLLELDLKHTNIGGSIPEELYFGNFQQLSALILDDCQFSGTISTNIGRLSTLGFIFLSGNTGLSGTIPTQVGLLSDLRRFIVHWTGLTGTMPVEVCALRGANSLQKIKADCEELSDETTPVECATGCCTKCCSKETYACTTQI